MMFDDSTIRKCFGSSRKVSSISESYFGYFGYLSADGQDHGALKHPGRSGGSSQIFPGKHLESLHLVSQHLGSLLNCLPESTSAISHQAVSSRQRPTRSRLGEGKVATNRCRDLKDDLNSIPHQHSPHAEQVNKKIKLSDCRRSSVYSESLQR